LSIGSALDPHLWQLTITLSDEDDHSVPHGWRLAEFIWAVRKGATLYVRGMPHRVGIVMSPDSVALFHQTFHSSALANFPMPHLGATKEQMQKLELLLPVTHTIDTQQDMYDHTWAEWLKKKPDQQPSQTVVYAR
tara:strand:- start:337 stop:741 length:405 start_codon:yes stop_codon:yes gene_type:complete